MHEWTDFESLFAIRLENPECFLFVDGILILKIEIPADILIVFNSF